MVANRISVVISVQRAVRHGSNAVVIQRIGVIRSQRAVLNSKGTEVTYCFHPIGGTRNSTVLDCADDIRLNLDWRIVIGSQRVSVQVKDHRNAVAHINVFIIPQSDVPAQLDGAAGVDCRLQFLKGGHDGSSFAALSGAGLCNGYGDSAEGFVCVNCRTADAEV